MKMAHQNEFNNYYSIWKVCLLFIFVVPVNSAMDMTRYNEGKRQFDLLLHQSQMPNYGQCWVNAMTTIQAGCKRLTDETQTRLALAYLNCFLELQGLNSYECSPEMEVMECTKPLRESDRSSFTTFFTHTQNICYFLQAQIWHEQTEMTISRLADRSSQVASQLEESQRLQEAMMKSQSESLRNQEDLMNGTQSLRGIINSSSSDIRYLFEDLKTSTIEQRQIIGDVFDQLINLQSTILGEVSGFYSLFFYILALLVCYLLTSSARTSGARLWLFLVLTINIVVEQTFMRWIAGSKGDDELLYWLQKHCRRLALLVATGVLCVCSYMYQDITELNNHLLMEIRKQNSDIKRFIAVSGQTENSTPAKPDKLEPDPCDDSDYTSDNSQGDGWGDDDDQSDRTFILDENKQSDNDDDETEAGSHIEDAEYSQSSLWSELSDLRRATPIREMEGFVSSWMNQSHTEEHDKDETTLGHSYNLRTRTTTPNYKTSPALRVESPKSFSRTVQQLQEVSLKNSQLVRAQLRHSTGSPSQQEALHTTTSSVSSPRLRLQSRNSIIQYHQSSQSSSQ